MLACAPNCAEAVLIAFAQRAEYLAETALTLGDADQNGRLAVEVGPGLGAEVGPQFPPNSILLA